MWEEFPKVVGLAAVIVAGTGVASFAVLQMVKDVVSLWGVRLSTEVMTVSSSVLSVVLAAASMFYTGTPLAIAFFACIAARYAPGMVHDKARSL